VCIISSGNQSSRRTLRMAQAAQNPGDKIHHLSHTHLSMYVSMHVCPCVCVWMGLLSSCWLWSSLCMRNKPWNWAWPLANDGKGMTLDDKGCTICDSYSCNQRFWCKNFYDGKDVAQSKWERNEINDTPREWWLTICNGICASYKVLRNESDVGLWRISRIWFLWLEFEKFQFCSWTTSISR
jgi:hypothetical protein